MDFRISDTFTDSLTRLTGDEQKTVKTTAFDLQMNPANPGMKFHKLDRARDSNFWSIRVSRDIRLIVHKTASSLLLCYVDHHDKAYRWAEQRKLETHPKTGAAQIVKIRETVQEIAVPKYVEVEQAVPEKPALFADTPEDELLRYGVPVEWLDDVRQANEDSLLELADHLPSEAAEALLELATGGSPEITTAEVATTDPFEHPDAQRRFRVMHNVEQLAQALEYPWEKWTVFLHPAQRELVERSYQGPARVSGSAGTGKTIVALHRAVYLAREHSNARVLLTTFSQALGNVLKLKLRRLIAHEPHLAERIDVASVDSVARRLYTTHIGTSAVATQDDIRRCLKESLTSEEDSIFTPRFLEAEWAEVVDAWQLDTWEAYRDTKRLGRKIRLPAAKRQALWEIFSRTRSALSARGLMTTAEIYTELASKLADRKHPPYDFIVVDEAQDVSVPQLRFFAAHAGERPNALFFAGDLGQRIFQTPFSWKSLGVDIRGRSRTLKINYRTSHQIRSHADRLLGPSVSDVDGITENRRGTVSVFNGPLPEIMICNGKSNEIESVARWLTDRNSAKVSPHEIGLIVRSEDEIERAIAAADAAGMQHKIIDSRIDSRPGHIAICTMHLAKGLEYRCVAVMGCDDEVIPLQSRIETVADEAELEEVYNTERHLLYVACTRARDNLLITAVDPASEFLDDLKLV